MEHWAPCHVDHFRNKLDSGFWAIRAHAKIWGNYGGETFTFGIRSCPIEVNPFLLIPLYPQALAAGEWLPETTHILRSTHKRGFLSVRHLKQLHAAENQEQTLLILLT